MAKETSVLGAVRIAPPKRHDASVIWLHGLGADGNDFSPVVSELELPADHGIRFVFPHAPKRPITINDGMTMRGWYDIRSPELDVEEDATGIQESALLLNRLVEEENREGIPAQRILLIGFSQGAAIALYTGLRSQQLLAGLVCLSGYLPLARQWREEWFLAQHSSRIMMLHGQYDPVVPMALARQGFELLHRQGYQPQWYEYPIQHNVCTEELQTLSRFLCDCLSL